MLIAKGDNCFMNLKPSEICKKISWWFLLLVVVVDLVIRLFFLFPQSQIRLPQPLPRLASRSDQWIAGPAVALWGIRTRSNFIKSHGSFCANFLVLTYGLQGPVFQI